MCPRYSDEAPACNSTSCSSHCTFLAFIFITAPIEGPPTPNIPPHAYIFIFRIVADFLYSISHVPHSYACKSIVLSLDNDEYYLHSAWLLLQYRSCREGTSVVPRQGDGTVCNERNALFGDAGVQYLQLRGRQRGLQTIMPTNKREDTLAESDYGPESSDFGASLNLLLIKAGYTISILTVKSGDTVE